MDDQEGTTDMTMAALFLFPLLFVCLGNLRACVRMEESISNWADMDMIWVVTWRILQKFSDLSCTMHGREDCETWGSRSRKIEQSRSLKVRRSKTDFTATRSFLNRPVFVRLRCQSKQTCACSCANIMQLQCTSCVSVVLQSSSAPVVLHPCLSQSVQQ